MHSPSVHIAAAAARIISKIFLFFPAPILYVRKHCEPTVFVHLFCAAAGFSFFPPLLSSWRRNWRGRTRKKSISKARGKKGEKGEEIAGTDRTCFSRKKKRKQSREKIENGGITCLSCAYTVYYRYTSQNIFGKPQIYLLSHTAE